MNLRPFVLFASLGLATMARLCADPVEVIDRARAYLGNDAELSAVRSVHFVGLVTSTNTTGDGVSETEEATVEIIFQKPFQQRIVSRDDEKVEVTALDDYEGWQRVEDAQNPRVWRMTILPKEQIKRLRANTWENLNFYRGLEAKGGEVRDLGTVELDGEPARKLAFVHEDDIVFVRYFDPATGRLRQTETGTSTRIRESGEIRANGIRFPERVITSIGLPDGGHRVITVVFQSVTLNEAFPDDLFRVPFMSARGGE
ncbi:MAG TPA: hypothetical protein VHF69_01170 [Candidatus Synoicihabitans sp.]|nr:hypothetical protein [Candidatus Synoicihabitans sp.]